MYLMLFTHMNHSMLNKDAIELARRHEEAYNEYFGKIPEESLLAFMLNPLLITNGSEEIVALMGADNGNEIIKDAKRVLVKELKKFWRVKLAKSWQQRDRRAETVTRKDNQDFEQQQGELSAEERLRISRAKMKGMTRGVGAGAEGMIEEMVEKWLTQDFDPEGELRAQLDRMKRSDKSIDWERVSGNETLYISSHFNLYEWWKSKGRMRHGWIYPLVPVVTAMPPSNAYMERIFSTCTWFDNPLRQRLSDKKFEMAVIIAVNECILNEKEPSDERKMEIVEMVEQM